MDPKSLFSLNDHLEMLSRHGDPLEVGCVPRGGVGRFP